MGKKKEALPEKEESVFDSKVLVGRMAGNPNVYALVTNKRLEIAVDLGAFIKLIAKEAGNPSLLLTVAQMEKKLLQASAAILRKMKKESERMDVHGFRG